MNFRKLAMTAVLGASLISTPIMAQTAQYHAAPVARAGVAMDEANAQAGDFPFAIVFVLLGAIGLGLALGGSDKSTPASV